MTGDPHSLRDSYDNVASAYAEHLYHELDKKPLDRHLLNRFAEETAARGLVADVGCGPGQVGRYLHDRGVQTLGIDLSPKMIRLASGLNPGMQFQVGDMRSLDLPDASLAGIVAFYSVIHLGPADIAPVFREFRRVLADDGTLLVAFHIGDKTLHVDDMWGKSVSLDFRFLHPPDVTAALESAGFTVTESTEREPYEGAEHPSRRCYLFAIVAARSVK